MTARARPHTPTSSSSAAASSAAPSRARWRCGGAGRIVVIERGRPVREASGAAAGVLAVASSRAPRGVAVRAQARQRGAVPVAGRRSCATRPASTSSTRPPACSTSPSPAATPSSSTAWWRAGASRASRSSCWTPSGARPPSRGEPRGAPRRVVCRRPLRSTTRAWSRRCTRRRARAASSSALGARGDADRGRRAGASSRVDAGGERLAPGHLIVAAGAWSAEVGALLGVKIPVRADRGEMVAVRPRAPLAADALLARRLPGAAPRRRGADRQHQRARRDREDRHRQRRRDAARPRRAHGPGAGRRHPRAHLGRPAPALDPAPPDHRSAARLQPTSPSPAATTAAASCSPRSPPSSSPSSFCTTRRASRSTPSATARAERAPT